ncbi:hypothetical protein [Anditalea andensis]|uniref:Uncharacterized protein n=1 Tax=Anditalea andensis TaxID=1048983 RepID=A0A074KVG4_9BACT|nr:hypothetical protein [Anditalea andensis]KEO72225.1 hypothetical protein EL17_18670 [Anditalea andensis]
MLAPTQEEFQNFFSPAFSGKLRHASAQPDTDRQKSKQTMSRKTQPYSDFQTQWTRTPAANSGFASCGVTVVNSSAVFQFNFSAGLTVLCPEFPHERQAPKRVCLESALEAECFEMNGRLMRNQRLAFRWRLAGVAIKPPYAAISGNTVVVNG